MPSYFPKPPNTREQDQIAEICYDWLQTLFHVAIEQREALATVLECLDEVTYALSLAEEDAGTHFNDDVRTGTITLSDHRTIAYYGRIVSNPPEGLRDWTRQDTPLLERLRRDMLLVELAKATPDPKFVKRVASQLDLRGVDKPWEGEAWYPDDLEAALPRLIDYLRHKTTTKYEKDLYLLPPAEAPPEPSVSTKGTKGRSESAGVKRKADD